MFGDYMDGMTMEEVAKSHGVTKQRIHQIFDRYKFPRKKPIPQAEPMRLMMEERFWIKVAMTADPDKCWEWQSSKCSTGYGKFSTVERTNDYAHRLAWVFTYGAIPKGLHVCHHCDNPPCVNPNHLFLGTHQDNMRDRELKGRNGAARRNRNNGKYALSIEQEKRLRELRGSGKTYHWLAGEFGISYNTAVQICRRERTQAR